jgi:hypothetical protein
MPAVFSRRDQGGAKSTGREIRTALAVVLLAFACRPSGDPARAAIDALAQAAHERDAKAFLELVAPDFQAADGSRRSDVDGMLQRFFAAWETLDVRLRDLTIERSEGAAIARFRAELSGKPRRIGGLEGLFPSSSSWRFETRLAPSDGKWRVTWASWSEER